MTRIISIHKNFCISLSNVFFSANVLDIEVGAEDTDVGLGSHGP